MQATTPQTAYQPRGWHFVRSDRNAAHFYRVSVDPRTDLYVCECPDHVNRHRDCKHIRAVQQGGGIVATPKARASRPVIRIAGDGFGFVAPEGA